MFNLSNVPPPDYITINGKDYEVFTDYRIWADITVYAQEQLYDKPSDESQTIHNWGILAELQRRAFARILPEAMLDVWVAMLGFMRGYPREENEYSQDEKADGSKTFSLKHDMNLIVLAIRNQSGIDISYRCGNFHWWLFLLEFQSLDNSHLIVNIMQWRAYEGEDKELIRRRERVALPVEYTKSEKAMIDELERMFPNT